MTLEETNHPTHVGFEEIEPFDFASPEKNLLRAVLMSALNDLKKEGDLARKATEFLLSTEEEYIFSFRSICDFLSVDPLRVLRMAGLAPNKLNAQEIIARLPVEPFPPKSEY